MKKLALFAALFMSLALSPGLHAQEEEVEQENRAEIHNALCTGADLRYTDNPDQNKCASEGTNSTEKLNDLLAQIVNIFSVVVGVVAVLMIIYGGLRYITSGGSTANVSTAKNTILYAIIGLIIVAFAQFIVKFVLSKATTIAS